MDRDLDALDGAPGFSFRRLWVTLAVCTAVIAGGAYLVRTFPNSGHQAGYDAVLNKGGLWVQSEVEVAQGAALPACQALHRDSETSESEPRFDYDSFVAGCGEAVDHLMGRHIPLLPAGG